MKKQDTVRHPVTPEKTFFSRFLPALVFLLAAGLISCTEHPDLDSDVQPESLFEICYSQIAEIGEDGVEENLSGYVRQMWNANELTTDEAICAWGFEGIVNFCFNSYDASHPMLNGYFNRLYAGISLCDKYLQEFEGYDLTMSAEIRFLRALHYFLLMDGWGNVPFITGSFGNPVQYSRSELFTFIESELLDIEPQLGAAIAKKSSDFGYGRVDKAAAWLLLARLYLNAEVYTGSQMYGKAAQYAQQVMNSSYKLNTSGVGSWSPYQMLFMADNGETDAAYEAIFPIRQEGVRAPAGRAMLFLIASTHDDDMSDSNGLGEAWGANRARPELIAKWFPGGDAPEASPWDFAKAAGDDRALIDSRGRIVDNQEVSSFKNGFAVAKYTNFTSSGSSASSFNIPDTDFFLFRAAEAYLTFAEAEARQNGGTAIGDASQAINALRKRANARLKDIYTLNAICDEWCREFYFEGRRRMDLIRFGRFGGSNDYLWQWKGGSYGGRTFDEYRNLFAIPAATLNANSDLTQNPGYRD